MFKHLGASENKAIVEISLQELNINISVPNCEVVIVFQRGERKVQSVPTQLVNKQAIINQVLKIPTTLFYDIKRKEYQQKTGTLLILVKYEKGVKQAGLIELDFSTYLNMRIAHKQERFPLQKCPDPNATLSFNVNFLSQLEQRSKTPEANISNIREQQSKEQIGKLIKENAELKEKLNHTPTVMVDNNDGNGQIIEINEKLKIQNQELQLENSKLREELQFFKTQKNTQIVEKPAKDPQKNELLYEANNNLKEQIAEMEGQQQKLKKENGDLKNRLQIQNQQLVDSRERIQQLENELEESHNDSKIQQYQEMVEKLNQELLIQKNQIQKKGDELEILSKERKEYENALDTLSKQYDQLGSQIYRFKRVTY